MLVPAVFVVFPKMNWWRWEISTWQGASRSCILVTVPNVGPQ